MKLSFTLLAFAFFATTANAQISENFENYSALSASCWQLVETHQEAGADVINGTYSIGTNGATTSYIRTPYMDISGTCTVSFKYRLNNKLNNNSERVIEIGTTDKNGNFVAAPSSAITLNKHTNYDVNYSFSNTLSLQNGTRRITIRVNTNSGDGNSNVVFDDLNISSPAYHYSGTHCNTAPVATDTIINTFGYATFNGNLVARATDANAGETLTFAADTLPSSKGTLVLNADGTFAFTPFGNFSGGPVTFTYTVTDNGYDPLRSNIATVTLNYPAQITLPVYISSFAGSVANSKAQLSWTVAQNQDGDYFQLEKSTDAKTFTAAALVMNTGKAGSERYSYADAKFNGTSYYRLKVINKSGAVAYSKIILLQEAVAAKANNLTLLQNPVTSAINFTYQASANGAATVNLYTTAGVKIYTSQLTLRNGLNQSSISVDSRITKGAYILEVVNGSERSLAKVVKY